MTQPKHDICNRFICQLLWPAPFPPSAAAPTPLADTQALQRMVLWRYEGRRDGCSECPHCTVAAEAGLHMKQTPATPMPPGF